MSTRAYSLISHQKELQLFFETNKSVPWLCFDTEFVGEKRFLTRICLIQVVTPHGNYLIDPFEINDLGPFLTLLTDPGICKITHAGDNDYRLFYTHFDVVPANVFDTQVAAAFAGYKYPVSFKKLVENELRLSLSKGYAVADWEARPFNPQQLSYALDDVLPLYELWQSLTEKLKHKNRLSWAEEECARWEDDAFYARDPHQEALNSGLMKALNAREQVFLLRLFAWRRQVASQKDYSKEMVLPSKLIGTIVKSMSSGRDALRQNRRIPEKIVHQYGAEFERLYRTPATDEEKTLLEQVQPEEMENPREEILIEMLHLLVKQKSFEAGISPALVIARNALARIKADAGAVEEYLGRGWRRQLLGERFVEWLLRFDQLQLDINDGTIELRIVSDADYH